MNARKDIEGWLLDELQLIAPSADRLAYLCSQYLEMHKASKVKTQPALAPVELGIDVTETDNEELEP